MLLPPLGTLQGRLRGFRRSRRLVDLLDVVAVTDPRVFEDVGVVLDFGDDGG